MLRNWCVSAACHSYLVKEIGIEEENSPNLLVCSHPEPQQVTVIRQQAADADEDEATEHGQEEGYGLSVETIC
jgi:hypothetical protein